MASGVAAGLRENGLKVPRDVLLAGFDDIEWLQDFRPALTTVGLPLEESGRFITLGALSDDATSVRIAGRVILRESTGGA
ncbi:substrate-binding domain-containing protein [Arthrobacter dokdonensis]|uniref:substrate-binding domain-containing protein n=1 Tax=Arthrobacter dokdonellae TaxID=2211210 RepID=UPI001F23CC90|nr:substrate-binding domain-containing protein [Arthrobacter dokdonellae]